MSGIGVLIVDDEEPARLRLRDLLDGEVDFSVLAEAANGMEAVEAIVRLAPRLVFLDIQMPDMSGLDVIRAVGAAHMPLVVMVTAYDRYALQAFDLCALDYLLKPYDDDRFRQTLIRVRNQLRMENLDKFNGKLLSLIEEMSGHSPAGPERQSPGSIDTPVRIAVRHRGRLVLLNASEIDYISAEGPYARIHTKERGYLIRERMKDLEARLAARDFFRVHRSVIVNLDRIDCLVPHQHGEYRVQMTDGTLLELSRTRRRALKERLDLMG